MLILRYFSQRRKNESWRELEEETGKKLTAHAFAQSFLSDLVPTVFTNMEKHGYINDPVALDIEQGFLPWLMSQVSKQLEDTDIEKPDAFGKYSPTPAFGSSNGRKVPR